MAERMFHGFGYPMIVDSDDVDTVIEKLEGKRNRTERKAQLITIQSLNRGLRKSFGTVAGSRIEAELGRRFKAVYKLRAKG